MLFRSSAAICGALVALAVSVPVDRSEACEVHSSAVVDAASGEAIVGAASMYNPFKPGKEEGGPNTASGERYDPSVWAAACLLYTSPSPRDGLLSRMPSSA